MNWHRIERLLSDSLANQFPEFPDVEDRKTCVALKPFDLDGRSYLLKDSLELEAKRAKQFFTEGKVMITRGGRADKVRVGDYLAPGFRPWDEPNGLQKSDFDELLLCVAVLKPSSPIIVGLTPQELPPRFYFPWEWIKSKGFCLRDDVPLAGRDAVLELVEVSF